MKGGLSLNGEEAVDEMLCFREVMKWIANVVKAVIFALRKPQAVMDIEVKMRALELKMDKMESDLGKIERRVIILELPKREEVIQPVTSIATVCPVNPIDVVEEVGREIVLDPAVKIVDDEGKSPTIKFPQDPKALAENCKEITSREVWRMGQRDYVKAVKDAKIKKLNLEEASS
jgi:hypothetical protein